MPTRFLLSRRAQWWQRRAWVVQEAEELAIRQEFHQHVLEVVIMAPQNSFNGKGWLTSFSKFLIVHVLLLFQVDGFGLLITFRVKRCLVLFSWTSYNFQNHPLHTVASMWKSCRRQVGGSG